MYSGIEDRVFLERVAVTSYGPQGFTINNDIELHGHVMLLPQLPMLWRPNSENPLEFTRDSFSVLDLLYPKPELIVMGTGTSQQFPSQEIREWAASNGIPLEVMRTGSAIGVFNVCCMENRNVAAVLLRPQQDDFS